jgi:spore coat polysaccharide biosynthesis protein SpsF
MSSRRLPGKVLADVAGKPMILRQLERIMRARRIDQLVVATSTHETDDPLVEVLLRQKIEVFRGSLHDVASRFMAVVKLKNPVHVVRLTADCPLADPEVIDLVIDAHLRSDFSYSSNTGKRTFPHGLDVEIFRASAFERLCAFPLSRDEREHVTLGFHNPQNSFDLQNVTQKLDWSAFRWTVDYQEDLDFVRSVYEEFRREGFDFTSEDVVSSRIINPRS